MSLEYFFNFILSVILIAAIFLVLVCFINYCREKRKRNKNEYLTYFSVHHDLEYGREAEVKPTTNKFNFHKEKDEGYEYYLSGSPDIHMENKPKKPQIEKFTICALGAGNEVEIENLLADLEPLDEHFLETTSLKQLLLEYKQLNLVPSQSTSQDKQEDEGYEYYLAGSPDSPTLCKRKKLIIKDDITLENINPHFEKLKTEVAKLAQIPKEFKPSLYPSVMGSDPESDEKAKDLVKEKEDQR